MINTIIYQSINEIPHPKILYKQCIAQTVMEEIRDEKNFLCFIYYHDKDTNIRQFFYQNGGGGEVYIAFSKDGHIVKGFDHGAITSPFGKDRIWPKIYEGLPETLHYMLLHPKLLRKDIDDLFPGELGSKTISENLLAPVSFCAWWENFNGPWKHGNIEFPENDEDDGSGWLIGNAIKGDVHNYLLTLRENDKVWHQLVEESVKKLEKHTPLKEEFIHRINPKVDASKVIEFAEKIGYGKPFPY